MPTLEEQIAPQVAVMRVVVAGLATGPLVFLVVVLSAFGGAEADGEPIVWLIGLAAGAIAVVAHHPIGAAVRGAAVSAIPSPVDADLTKLTGAYTNGLMVSCAVCEGAAFFNLVAYMLEGVVWSIPAALVLTALIAIRFPTAVGVADWIREAVRETEQRRRLRGDA